jgi:hypothetical protein
MFAVVIRTLVDQEVLDGRWVYRISRLVTQCGTKSYLVEVWPLRALTTPIEEDVECIARKHYCFLWKARAGVRKLVQEQKSGPQKY